MWVHHGVPLVTGAGSHRCRHGILSRGGRTHMKVVKCFLDRDAERLLGAQGSADLATSTTSAIGGEAPPRGATRRRKTIGMLVPTLLVA
jgi:hypothetical protein